MGLTAENLQAKYSISREEQDEFAFRSQSLARKSIDAGYFTEEIIPVMVSQGKNKPPLEFKLDEHPRLEPLEKLAKLQPAFKKDGTVTAGNASGINDGAAFALLMTAQKAKELGYEPMARWICGADYGIDPAIMGVAPAYAIPIALKRAGLKLSDLDVIECNEAFAAQNLAVIKELANQTGEKVDMEMLEPHGRRHSLRASQRRLGRPDRRVRNSAPHPHRRTVRIVFGLLRRRPGSRHDCGEYEALEN